MKLMFAGTPEFAAVALKALLAAGHDVCLVLTQPDRPAGRGMRTRESSVKTVAIAHGLTVAQPENLKSAEVQAMLRSYAAEAMVVAAYGLILPVAVLEIPARGCVNIHASLLPRWRGAAPIQRALLAGDSETGITIMQMNAGLDTGDILLQERTPITAEDTAHSLHDRLAGMGGRCIVRALNESPLPQVQDDALANYAAKITKTEAAIDWTLDAAEICRRVRAYNPVPGAVTTLDGDALKIWAAQPAVARDAEPGTVLASGADGIIVAAGGAAVRILELQKAGGKRLAAAAFLGGTPLPAGTRLGGVRI
jgi:methionyl-tRNA formyltransferase